MASNMSKSHKKIVEGDRYVDRISSLPKDVIECILKSMPTRDAARTCVLSSSWRYTWADHPSLVLDRRFLDDIQRNRSPNELVIDYPNIVNKILLPRIGHIRKFCIYVSLALSSMPHTNIDSWLSSLCRRGLKELRLINYGRNPYRVPCSVFYSSDLIKSNLYFCIIKSGCIANIKTLTLENVSFDSSVVLTTPLLTNLSLERCSGIIHFDISAPRLENIILHGNDDLNLKPFLGCTGILRAVIFTMKAKVYSEGFKSFSLVKLLAAWPKIFVLMVNGFCFKYFATGSIPFKLDLRNMKYLTILNLSLDSELMPWIICILRNSPSLCTLNVLFGVNDMNGSMSDSIDESRSVPDFRMDKLHRVNMKGFTATSNELVLAKILLQCAPGLENMIVEENTELDPKERGRILKNVSSLEPANPKARIVFRPNMCYGYPWNTDRTV